jgi:hypothetical protein
VAWGEQQSKWSDSERTEFDYNFCCLIDLEPSEPMCFHLFDGIQPNLNCLLATIREELHQWDLAGARGVRHLLTLLPGV